MIFKRTTEGLFNIVKQDELPFMKQIVVMFSDP